MPLDVEVNLRIPSVKEPALDVNGYPINSADVRFIRGVSVPALPKPGAILHLETAQGMSLACEVRQADWSESKALFIVYCTYAKRSIPVAEYHALLNDPAWERRSLL